MDIQRLKRAETEFLARYPEGFNHPEMIAIGKKHKMSKMIDIASTDFADYQFERPDVVLQNFIKIIRQSSMVSMFEKPKFRDFANMMDSVEKEHFVEGLNQRLHGDEQLGFEMMLDILKTGKMAKWTIMTILPTYFRPTFEVFVKPTTVKGAVAALKLQNLDYRPMPNWEFYCEFRRQVNELKTCVDPNLSPSNAAFTGFLMMSL